MYAGDICHKHIGKTIKFEWNFPTSDVAAVICDELRQYSADGDNVYLMLTGAASTGDLEEFVLEPYTEVEIIE